jgi:hypothetical protein
MPNGCTVLFPTTTAEASLASVDPTAPAAAK